MIEAGVHIIMVCGGTGEFAYLNTEEKRRLVEISARHVEGRAMFVAQTSAISTRDTIEATKHAADQGVDAAMILPPYFEGPDLEEVAPLVRRLPGIVVVDHMGRPDVAEGIEGAGFRAFMEFLAEDTRYWVKVSCPERLTVAGPPYDDVVPFARALVERFPDRVLWGTDWPHPNMKSHMPDDGNLVDFIPKIAPTVEEQQKLLVDNPMRLYWAR